MYTITYADKQYRFREDIGGGRINEGALVQGDEWLEGKITGGFFRIKLRDTIGREVVSNFRKSEDAPWGKDTIARKATLEGTWEYKGKRGYRISFVDEQYRFREDIGGG